MSRAFVVLVWLILRPKKRVSLTATACRNAAAVLTIDHHAAETELTQRKRTIARKASEHSPFVLRATDSHAASDIQSGLS